MEDTPHFEHLKTREITFRTLGSHFIANLYFFGCFFNCALQGGKDSLYFAAPYSFLNRSLAWASSFLSTLPVVGLVPSLRRKSRMCGSGEWMA